MSLKRHFIKVELEPPAVHKRSFISPFRIFTLKVHYLARSCAAAIMYFSCSKYILHNNKKFGTDLRLTWRHHLNFLALKITCVKNEKLSLSRRHDLFWNFVFVLHSNSWHCTVMWQWSGSHQSQSVGKLEQGHTFLQALLLLKLTDSVIFLVLKNDFFTKICQNELGDKFCWDM